MTTRQEIRAARDAQIAASMQCTCGGPSEIDHRYTRPFTDGGMGTYTRRRICRDCYETWKTVEIDATELASLRLTAHLYLASLSAKALA